MTIRNLIEAITPPSEPTFAFDESWEFENPHTETLLPLDYKELMRLYGAGTFLGLFEICGPRSPTPEGRISNFYPSVRSTFIYAHRGSWFYDDPPLPIFPRPGGLLAFGQTRCGDYLFWLTRGAVNEWPIVIWDTDTLGLETFECDLSDFLSGFARGTRYSAILSRKGQQPDTDAGFEVASRPWPSPWDE